MGNLLSFLFETFLIILQKNEDNKYHIQGLCGFMFTFMWHLLSEIFQEFYEGIFVEI